MKKKCTWFLVLFLMGSACLDEPDCFRLNNNIIGISFRKLVNSTADTVVFTGIRTEVPPVIFTGDTLTRISLPLNYFENETSFLFENADATWLLRLGYTSQAQFVSEDCGERFVISELQVLEHSFDSVRLLTNTPSADAGNIHIEIFQ